jgi:hypothetical protein
VAVLLVDEGGSGAGTDRVPADASFPSAAAAPLGMRRACAGRCFVSDQQGGYCWSGLSALC